jgi:arsenate reductase (thioredoxin)
MPTDNEGLTTTVLFVCLHGSAKSLIAAEHLSRLAAARGIAVHGESAGVEPDADVPPAVVLGLARDGIDVRAYRPRPLTTDLITAAARVVVCGCELPAFATAVAPVERWDDLPLVSDGYEPARSAIVARVEQLLARVGPA